MASYILTVIGYPTSESTGAFEWAITGARGKHLAAGRGTITGRDKAAPLAVERLTYHALFAGLQALLAEDYAGALTIAAAPAFIALLRQSDHPGEPGLQRLRRHAVQLLNQVRGELTLHEQLVVPPLLLEATEPPRTAKPLPLRGDDIFRGKIPAKDRGVFHLVPMRQSTTTRLICSWSSTTVGASFVRESTRRNRPPRTMILGRVLSRFRVKRRPESAMITKVLARNLVQESGTVQGAFKKSLLERPVQGLAPVSAWDM